MAENLLVGIGSQGVTAARWRGSGFAQHQVFANDETGRAAFEEFLASVPDLPTYFVVDAIEEDYRFETLPHAFGQDRADMVARKLKQHYRNTPYTAATLVGRNTGKRRDDRYLFTALTNPELINDWLQAVVARGLPVAGVYLLPMLSGALVERVGPKTANLLLVFQSLGTLRLTFFHNGQFQLSRLTRSEGGKAENRARYYAEEIANTRLYLHALRTLTLDEHLTVLLMDRNDDLTEVAASIARDNPGLECVRVGRRELTSRLKISELQLDTMPYVIALRLLAIKAPENNLAPENVTVGYKRYQARRAVYAGCGVLAAAAAVWTGVNFFQMMMLRGETADAARQTSRHSAQYLEIARQFPQAPASAENLKKTVEIAQKLRDSLHTPQRMMTLVSRALETSPTIVIREFGWKYGATEIETESAGRRAAGTEPAAPPTPETASARRRESALIEGEIRPFRGDFRGAIDTINGFARRLSEEPEAAEVRVVTLPLNVDPTLSLTGNTLDNPEQAGGSANFKLMLVLKPAK